MKRFKIERLEERLAPGVLSGIKCGGSGLGGSKVKGGSKFGGSKVKGGSKIKGFSKCGGSKIKGFSKVKGGSHVKGFSKIKGGSKVVCPPAPPCHIPKDCPC